MTAIFHKNHFFLTGIILIQSFWINAQDKPQPLRSDIQVEHFMDVGPKCIRLLVDPISGGFFYTTLGGDIFQVKLRKRKKPKAKKIITAKDHEITRLQGAIFLDSALILVGNISVNNRKGTKGRMVRYQLLPSGKREKSVVFMTDEVGSTKTIYDHGFNGVAISPDKKYFYVSSGARTDHGEVQDNDSEYPNSRDEPLTACILRIPVEAKNLLLVNDSAKLVEEGYLYAEGVRNAFDMAFSPNGHLFAVSNSGDYDHPEDMFWIREGHHYGFPWVMGGIKNPMQDHNWFPDADKDLFINKFSHAYSAKHLRNDPDFPSPPTTVSFTQAVQNLGPDADFFRDRETGEILDGDKVGRTVGTFTPHRSLLGLFFDTDSILTEEFKGDGFVMSWTNGIRSVLMKPFGDYGVDLMHLNLIYKPEIDNYFVETTRIVGGFNGPADAVMVDNQVYIIEYGSDKGNIWKIILPKDQSSSKAKSGN